MCAKKAAPPQVGTATKAFTLAWRGRWLLVVLVFLGLLGFGWSLAWEKVRDHVLADKDYRLSPDDIVISPPPPWIRTKLKDEVLRSASLDGTLSILDDDLTKRIANAFSLHPWVDKVHRVSKHHPARVDVQLSYRQPVAMVEVEGTDQDMKSSGRTNFVVPIDAEGNLLPSKDFLAFDGEDINKPSKELLRVTELAKNLPRVLRIESQPAGPVGKSWGDVQVTGAAQIITTIGDRWQKWKLHRLLAPIRGGDVDAYTFEITTRAGTRILWGRPPGGEPKGEPTAAAKVARLEQIASATGSLEAASGPHLIDLRTGGTLRTAIKGLGQSQ